mmetsp:Transcript_72303/g.143383  ORF Transcript_72303/g.143383 Transcript_72303/m.143383 type:complete len:220 (-) Transcript_72303:913-1572(-)
MSAPGRIVMSPSFTNIMLTASSFIALISEAVTLAAVIADAEADISSQVPRRSTSSWSSGVTWPGDTLTGGQGGQWGPQICFGERCCCCCCCCRCLVVGVAGELQEGPSTAGPGCAVVADPIPGPVPNTVAGVQTTAIVRLDEEGPGEPTTNVGSSGSRRAGELATAVVVAAAAAAPLLPMLLGPLLYMWPANRKSMHRQHQSQAQRLKQQSSSSTWRSR